MTTAEDPLTAVARGAGKALEELQALGRSAELSSRLDAASKMDRDPKLIRMLEADGERQAEAFLRRRAAGTVDWEIYAP